MRTVSSTIPRKAVMCESEQCSGEWKSAYFFSVGFEVFLVAICRALPPEAGGAGAGCGGMTFVFT